MPSFFLENKYLPHNKEQGTFIEDIPSQECLFTFEEMSDSIKKNLKCIGEADNMTAKNKALLGGWISMASKVFRREENLHGIKTATWKSRRYTVIEVFTSW